MPGLSIIVMATNPAEKTPGISLRNNSGDRKIMIDAIKDILRLMGEAPLSFTEARERLNTLTDKKKYPNELVNSVLDDYFMVVDNNLHGEKFIAMKIEHSVPDDEITS
jgi:hypothetical protein